MESPNMKGRRMANIRRAKQAVATLQRGARNLEASGTTALKVAEMAGAAGTVIAARNALGLQALATPVAAVTELSRLVPEKLLALSAAGAAIGGHTAEMSQRMIRMASDEISIATKTAAQFWLCRTPADYLAIQNRLAMDWWQRAFSRSMSMSTLVTRSQAAALSPVHRTVTKNARRLSE
jgi:hypothetical protein